MNQRQESLLKYLIREHIHTAEPVGSKLLAEKYKLDISPATIRNDMSQLEEEGWLFQPHTSAGRLPTEKAYRYYIEKYIEQEPSLPAKEQAKLKKWFRKASRRAPDEETVFKLTAKQLAELSGLTALLAFGEYNVYYTGLGNLFRQPEFGEINSIYNLSQVIDRLDEVMAGIFNRVNSTEIKLGSQSYFDPRCAHVLTKARGKLIGLLGPMRMDYKHNLALLNYSVSLLEELK